LEVVELQAHVAGGLETPPPPPQGHRPLGSGEGGGGRRDHLEDGRVPLLMFSECSENVANV
jgi:hypothetical protein